MDSYGSFAWRAATALIFTALAGASTAHAQVDTSIVPAASRTTWAPGLQQTVPARATVCATLAASSFGDGAVNASAAIQQAIDGCPAGQTVQLGAGRFRVNDYVLINKAVTLRGLGPDVTRLVKTNGATPLSYIVADAQPLVIVGPSRWPKVADATSVALSLTVKAGATSLTVDNGAGFAPGQFVLLDEDDYTTAAWQPLPPRMDGSPAGAIWASDRVVFQKHSPAEWTDDPFPSSLTWFSRAGRPLNEIKEIAAVSGRKITFTTPVHADYLRAKRAQLTRFAQPHVRGAGVENLALEGGGDGNLRFEAAAYSWAKNVESVLWLGDGVSVNQSFRVEVRDSYVHDTAWPQPGGGGYGVSLAAGSSDILIENNAVTNVNKVIVVRSCGAGSVVGYNYMDNGFILGTPDWTEVGLNASHMSGSHHVLFEGNEAWNYDSDNTHGNAIAMTVFRNHLTGRRLSFPGMANARGIGLMFGSWWQAFIGNVIGEPDRMANWVAEDPGDGTYGNLSSAWGPWPAVWRLGYDPGRWDQTADPKVRQTAYRHGNFDFLTNRVQWTARQSKTLPPSLYLRAKPAFFGTLPWPWVDPVSGTKLGVLPAKLRSGLGGPLFVTPPAE